jgi:hypothetical protein
MASALSLGGCSSAITTKDLTILEEAEKQTEKQTITSEEPINQEEAVTADSPALREDTASSIAKANDG